ncbi:flagellar biosynthesis regulator FlaF [Microvirga tunisiensis]|uniref:Flagellar biosynthesis regulator FlaF n=2 Tax=Pannonibacter tanglangensis TaxID=2750084 RepID=A0ABW9ZKD7_9HYPH|nr:MULTISPECIES: flagellar biosynthesis regulator FlaF [unclassified Pannonibacter]NBN63524.1 flagellar biosynthesis regulator FlaF [Pannonibacter sp. XCT-34]NBN77161.1 flagellar biosynthesis regulator FlaF [Pannonibacter sp. XCT-53]
MYKQAAQAYQKTSQVAVSPRELEATILMKAAARLQLVKDEWEQTSFAEKDEALTYNRKLWTVLVTSVTSPDNPLPQPIKDNIATLGVFIFRHTMDILMNPEPDKLGTLISINRSIAEGLRAQPQTAG